MSIEKRAEAKYPYLINDGKLTEGSVRSYNTNIDIMRENYIAGATEQQALIDQQKIAANTPPADLLKAYSTFEENAAHQLGFLIGCEWKEARIKELEEAICEISYLTTNKYIQKAIAKALNTQQQ